MKKPTSASGLEITRNLLPYQTINEKIIKQSLKNLLESLEIQFD